MGKRQLWLNKGVIGWLLGSAALVPVFAQAPVQTIPVQDQNTPITTMQNAVDTSSLTVPQRINRIENQLQYLTRLTQQMKQQQQMIITLNGKVETLQHQVSQLTETQKALSVMDQRLVQLETMQKLSRTNQAANEAMAQQKNVSKNESEAYNKAFNDLMGKQYQTAIKGFQDFIKTYPKSHLLGDAYYWLGELYLVQGQPDKASQQFRRVIASPENTKTPDAMFKLGSIFLAFGDAAHAKEMFQKLVKNYPGTHAAKLASERLKTLD